MRSFFRFLLPLAASAMAAQGAKPALDVLPEKTLGFLLFRDPVLSQVKLQGLMQRSGTKGDDPLTEAQKAFGLPQLPAGRQGMAIVYLEDTASGGAGGQREALYLSPPDCAAFLARLKATPKEKGFFEYKSGGRTYAAALRDGWVLLADATAGSQLKRMAAAPPLRNSLGSIGGWMEGEEAYGALTPKGLWAMFSTFKKASSGATGGKADAAQADAFMEKAEAELSLLAFRGHLDENGNLSASVRARLNPAGAWMAIGRDLPLASDFGLSKLPKSAYTVAAGGAIPRVWMEGLVDMSMSGLRASLSAQGVTDDSLATLDSAMKREGAHVQGLAMVLPGLGPVGMRMQLRVDDSRAYEDDLKAEVQALAEACKTKDLPQPVHFESRDLNGRRQFGAVPAPNPAWSGLDAEAQASLAKDQTRSTYLALDGQTVEAALGGADAANQLGTLGAGGSLADDDGIRRAAGMLPNEGTFFAFLNTGAIFQQQAASMKSMDGMLAKDLAQGLPPIPEAPDCPPVGLSIRFNLDQWDLSLALPVETQLAMGRTQEAMAKAQAARMKAFREQMQRNAAERKAKDQGKGQEQSGGTKAPEPDEDDGDEKDEYQVDGVVETPDPKD
ncbi:MAG TPA: hypothetical protein VL181_07475 [Holophagaceae bacterium]|nr:hypothetical protein [Holophagaceae bacterium]